MTIREILIKSQPPLPGKTMALGTKRKSERAAALLARKGKGRAIPKRVQECDEADLMLWEWRHAGKSWGAIKEEYGRMTGQTPGRSTLSVRLAKMEDNFIAAGCANV